MKSWTTYDSKTEGKRKRHRIGIILYLGTFRMAKRLPHMTTYDMHPLRRQGFDTVGRISHLNNIRFSIFNILNLYYSITMRGSRVTYKFSQVIKTGLIYGWQLRGRILDYYA